MDFKSFLGRSEEFIAVIFAIFTGFFTAAFFKMNNLFTFFNLDELLWHFRSRFFWDQFLNFDFSGLIQSAQPGVTVYWFAGFVMKFINYDFHQITAMIAQKEAQGIDFNFINENNPALFGIFQSSSFAFNAALMLCLVIFYIAFYYLTRKLGFNKIVSYFSLFFLTTNIYLAYWTTPSDKMLDIFLTLSFLTFLVFITKKGGKKYFWASAILGSLAVLSKLSALFILPFYFLISVYCNKPIDKQKLLRIIKDYLIWFLIFSLISVLLLPTIIFHPVEVYNLVFHPVYVYESDHTALGFFSKLYQYAKLLVQVILLSNLATASSVALIAFVVLSVKKKFKNVFSNMPKRAIDIILIYAITFMMMVILVSKNHDIRFMSPVFTILSIISGIGCYGVVEIARKHLEIPRNFVYASMVVVLIFANFFSIFSSGIVYEEFLKQYFNINIMSE